MPLHRPPAGAREREVRGVLGEGSPCRYRHRRLRPAGRLPGEERYHRRDEREGRLAPPEPDAVAFGDQPPRPRRGSPDRRPLEGGDARDGDREAPPQEPGDPDHRPLGDHWEPTGPRRVARRRTRRERLAAGRPPGGRLFPGRHPVCRPRPRGRAPEQVRGSGPRPRHGRGRGTVPGLCQLTEERRGVRKTRGIRAEDRKPGPRRLRR